MKHCAGAIELAGVVDGASGPVGSSVYGSHRVELRLAATV